MNNTEKLQKYLESKYPGHDFKWHGNDRRKIGLCPEHDDHNPSFNIYEYNGKAYYKCHACGFGGSLYDFISEELTPEQREIYKNNKIIQKTLSESFKEIKDYLFNGETVESIFARKYLKETRFLDLNAIKHCDIGLIETSRNYDEIDALLEPLSSGKPNKLEYYKGYLVFAHTDITGNICLLRFRSPDGNKDIKTAKIKGFNKYSFAFNLRLIGKQTGDYSIAPYIYITEGEFNSLTYISTAGLYNIISAGPKDNIKKELISQILDLDFNPVIALDQDRYGQDRLKKLYSEIKKTLHKNIIYCEYNQKDFDDLFKNKNDEGISEILQKDIKYKTFNEFEKEIFKEEIRKEIEIEKKIDNLILNKELKSIYLEQNNIKPLYTQRFYDIPEGISDAITDKNVFGVKIQFPAIFALTGPTGTGKTEFALDLADHVAKEEDCVSIFYQYEGSETELLVRAQRKGINNPDFFYYSLADLTKIEKDIAKFGDKKIFIVIDYYQLLARYIQSNENVKNDSIRLYMSKIFFFFAEFKKNNNICVCLLSSLNNDALKTLPSNPANEINRITILSGLKEDGDIAFNMDYAYALLYATKSEYEETKYSISRYVTTKDVYDGDNKKERNTVLLPVKYARIKGKTSACMYIFNKITSRYEQQN